LDLAPFKASCFLERTEHPQPVLLEYVDDSLGKWVVGTDNHKIDALSSTEFADSREVRHGNFDVVNFVSSGCARIAGSTIDPFRQRALSDLPAQRMLSSSTPYDEHCDWLIEHHCL